MKSRATLYWIGLALILFSLKITGYLVPLLSRLKESPWWIYFILAGVLFSGLKYFSISKAEEEIDQKWVEAQGKVYIDRIEKERESRKEQTKNKKNAM